MSHARSVVMTLLCLLPPLASAAPDDLHIDAARSRADFGVRILWLSRVTGVFDGIRGDILVNRATASAVVHATIEVSSLKMDNSRFRRWVLEPEFFDERNYPEITFDSDPLSLEALANGNDLEGTLTIRGVSQHERFTLLSSNCTAEKFRGCTLAARGSIDRTDYGMRNRRGALADRVDLALVINVAP
jgi:polyisoprenoid-binding protein YceI